MNAFNVLIVEDDPMVAMINKEYVCKNKGFTVAGTCKNGEEALRFLNENSVDLVILDVYMPVLDGVETLKLIREKKFPVEVIMVTAANDTSTLDQTMHLGVLDYLIKPFAFDRFQIAFEKFSAKKSALKTAEVLNQSIVDNIITGNHNNLKNGEVRYPKGIQKKTLDTIKEYFSNNRKWCTGDDVAKKVGVSIVTVRHYMNFLVSEKYIVQDINYSTGGRPCMLYRLNQ